MEAGIQAGIDILNANGGILGRKVEAIYKETFSMISQQLLSKFTKKQFEKIRELELF